MNCRAASPLDSKKNKLGIKDIDNRMYNKTFNMVTIVMQENPANEDELFVNRTNCKIYFNGTLISDRSTLNNELANENNTNSYSTVMKKNAGYLYINPFLHFNQSGANTVQPITETDDITVDVPLKKTNLTYHKYTLTSE